MITGLPITGLAVGSAIQVMLCLKRAAKTYDYPVCCRLAFARQHYLDTTTQNELSPSLANGNIHFPCRVHKVFSPAQSTAAPSPAASRSRRTSPTQQTAPSALAVALSPAIACPWLTKARLYSRQLRMR